MNGRSPVTGYALALAVIALMLQAGIADAQRRGGGGGGRGGGVSRQGPAAGGGFSSQRSRSTGARVPIA